MLSNATPGGAAGTRVAAKIDMTTGLRSAPREPARAPRWKLVPKGSGGMFRECPSIYVQVGKAYNMEVVLNHATDPPTVELMVGKDVFWTERLVLPVRVQLCGGLRVRATVDGVHLTQEMDVEISSYGATPSIGTRLNSREPWAVPPLNEWPRTVRHGGEISLLREAGQKGGAVVWLRLFNEEAPLLSKRKSAGSGSRSKRVKGLRRCASAPCATLAQRAASSAAVSGEAKHAHACGQVAVRRCNTLPAATASAPEPCPGTSQGTADPADVPVVDFRSDTFCSISFEAAGTDTTRYDWVHDMAHDFEVSGGSGVRSSPEEGRDAMDAEFDGCKALRVAGTHQHPNQHVLSELIKLRKSYGRRKHDGYRKDACDKAICAARRYREVKLETEDDVDVFCARAGIKVNTNTCKRIKDIVMYGSLGELSQPTKEQEAHVLFQKIWGVGQQRAKQLVQMGHYTYEALLCAPQLKKVEQAYLDHRHEFEARMSREEARAIAAYFALRRFETLCDVAVPPLCHTFVCKGCVLPRPRCALPSNLFGSQKCGVHGENISTN